LPEKTPSDDIKFTADWGEPSNPYWKDNFYTPQDNSIQECKEACKEAIDKLKNILPASFALIDNIPETFGVGNLELNPDLVIKKSGSMYSTIGSGTASQATPQGEFLYSVN
jgi:hypothetical protein